MANSGHPLGLHRVIEPKGALPQSAYRLDNGEQIRDNEIRLRAEILNITSASFARLKKEVGEDPASLAAAVEQIVAERGKYQDPVLGSGGMLVGTVDEIGPRLAGVVPLSVGQRLATLVSLTATPLKIDKTIRVNVQTDQVWVEAAAVLFEKSLYAVLPDDLPEEISLAVMDVAGAPAAVAKSVKAGDIALILGGGKAGLLALHEAKKRTGPTGKVVAVEFSKERCRKIAELQLADAVISADVCQPVSVMEAVERETGGELADFTLNVVNVSGSEMASILSTKDTGTVFFYNTATEFTRAALGAESVGKPLRMLIGNGYVPGHAEITFQILRENAELKRFFQTLYAT